MPYSKKCNLFLFLALSLALTLTLSLPHALFGLVLFPTNELFAHIGCCVACVKQESLAVARGRRATAYTVPSCCSTELQGHSRSMILSHLKGRMLLRISN